MPRCPPRHGCGPRSRPPGRRSRRRRLTGGPASWSCRSRPEALRSRPSSGVPRGRRAPPWRSRSPAPARRPRTPRRPTRRRSSSTCRSRPRCTAIRTGPRGHGVGDPIRPYFTRVVVTDGDPGPCPRADDQQRRFRPPLGEVLVLADQRRHGRGEADPGDLVEVDEVADQRPELVPGARRLGRHPPLLGQTIAVVEPEDRLRVAAVDR